MFDDPFGLNHQKKKMKLQDKALGAAWGTPAPLSMNFVRPDTTKGVVLERVSDVSEPDYCVHGRTRCYACDEWCYLGVETLKAVQGGVTPFCRQCAALRFDPDNLIGNFDDKGHSHHA